MARYYSITIIPIQLRFRKVQFIHILYGYKSICEYNTKYSEKWYSELFEFGSALLAHSRGLDSFYLHAQNSTKNVVFIFRIWYN